MDQRKPEYFTPALIAGAVSGVLSGIPLVNCLCCLWIIGGAALAAHLLAGRTDGPLTAGDGAIVGAMTGIVAAVVDALMGIPLRTVNLEFARRLVERMSEFADEMPSGWENWFDRGAGSSPGLFFLGLFLSAAIFAALGVLGGVIGASLFGRKKPAAPPSSPAGPGTIDAV
jgi:hypothetical protein